MNFCNKCNSNKIKTRSNYTHGKKSKAKTNPVECQACGSTDIGHIPNTRFGRTIRRR